MEDTETTKLLGMYIDADQDWQSHFKSLRSALNQRLFIIRRVQRQIRRNKLMPIVHSLWVRKLRYGLQLCVRVVAGEEDRKSAALKSLQLTQNRMLRTINGTRIKDKISIKSMLIKFDLLSVNQLAAQIKLTEVWKAKNQVDYAISLEPYRPAQPGLTPVHSLRPKTNRVYDDSSRLVISKQSFHIDAAGLWNRAPASVTRTTTLGTAKSAILKYVKSLPI